MLVYYYDKDYNLKAHLFNGIEDLEHKFRQGLLKDMEETPSNFALQSGDFVSDKLTNVEQMIEVLKDLRRSVRLSPNSYTGCSFELDAAEHFKGEEFWKGKLRKALTTLNIECAEEIAEQLIEEAFVNLETYDVAGNLASKVAEDAVKETIGGVLEETVG